MLVKLSDDRIAFVVVQLYRNRRRLGSSTEYAAAAVRVVTFGLVGLLALM